MHNITIYYTWIVCELLILLYRKTYAGDCEIFKKNKKYDNMFIFFSSLYDQSKTKTCSHMFPVHQH